jgi:hypothetical protein
VSGLVIAAIVLVSVAVYLLWGWHLAMTQLPVSRAIAFAEWSSERSRRSSLRQQTACIALFWPLMMPFRVARTRLDEAIDGRDPVALAAKVAERDRYIAQLEREAGIRP